MNKVSVASKLSATIPTTPNTSRWLASISHILEDRYQDEQSIQQLIDSLAEHTGIQSISLAVPDSNYRYRPCYSTLGISDGTYSFVVQNALCRQFDTSQWLLVFDDDSMAPLTALDKTTFLSQLSEQESLRCCLVPVFIRRSVLASLVIDLRNYPSEQLDLSIIIFIAAQIATVMATQVVPNFATLHARPYQKVRDSELGCIHQAVDKCNGNKTMAARLLGLTPRQLRYRLSKLEA